MTIDVIEPGPLTSVQDAIGRDAWRHVGVPAGGAADPWAARLANRLVGNDDGAALLEVTHGGPTLRVVEATAIAMVGELDASVDGLPLAPATAREVRAGALVRIGVGRDARGYLAVAGGLVAERVLGSASTDLRSGFGGLEGRALRPGDRLATGAARRGRFRWLGAWPTGPIRVVAGPHADPATTDLLVGSGWRIGADADRTGVRLDGPRLAPGRAEVPSMGLPLGAIQVPADGRPIVMLADRPVTGGYPVTAVVIRADVGRVARTRPGRELRFASVSIDEAQEALRSAENELAAIEPLWAPGDDDLSWAGAHG